VVHIDKIKNLGWSIGEVVERWNQKNKQKKINKTAIKIYVLVIFYGCHDYLP
jgi:hypothetical protein